MSDTATDRQMRYLRDLAGRAGVDLTEEAKAHGFCDTNHRGEDVRRALTRREASALIDDLLARTGAEPRPSYGRGRSRRSGVLVTRFSSGATVYRNARGRCEDAPCCGCCS